MANALHTPGVVDAKAARLDDAGLLALQGPGALDVRTGVLWGPGSTALVTGTSSTSPMRYSIAPHHWVTTRGAANGPYRGTLEAAKLVDTTAAPGSGSRIDVIWVKQQDNTAGIPTPDGVAAEQYGCTQGTATTGTPAKPAIPVGALELATATVAAGATATNGSGVVISQTARPTVARGADIPVRNQAERDALAPFWPLLTVKRLDTGRIERRNLANNAWETVYDPNPPAPPGVQLTGTGDVPIGTGAWASLLWPTEVRDDRDMHSLTTNTHRVTVPESRWYTISASAFWDGNTTGRRGIRISPNSDATSGTTNFELLVGAISNTRTAISAAMWLNAGEYVCVQVFHDSGANRTVSVNLSHMTVAPGPLT